jgi:hypothetical protein
MMIQKNKSLTPPSAMKDSLLPSASVKSTTGQQHRPAIKTREANVPVLRFSPTAWAKLLYFRDRGPTEIGGFGVASASDLLKVEDFITVKQEVNVASVAFDDQAVADFFDAQVDAGRKPEQFGRIWLHTHPGDCAEPSWVNEETFERVFGNCQWAVMFILARGGKSTARLRFNVGPGGQALIPIEVDFGGAFGPSDRQAWAAEHDANVHVARRTDVIGVRDLEDEHVFDGCSMPPDWLDELRTMEPTERAAILSDLSGGQAWEDQEVVYDF